MLDYIHIILLIVFSLLALSCIITNCLIFYVTITRTTIGGVFKYYICSLAITDILIGIVSIPGYLIFGITQVQIANEVYDIFSGTDMLLGVCSMWHISLMAFDRVMAINKPLFHRIHMRTRNAALKLLIIPWSLATLITVVNFVVVKSRHRHITTPAVGIVLPFIFTVVCYIIVFITIRKRNEQFSHIAGNSNIVNETTALKMILCVLAVFIVCWLPITIFNGFALHLVSLLNYSQAVYIIYAADFLRFMNSTCNPFVYAIFYPSYRSGVKDVLKRCFCRKGNSGTNRVMQPQGIEETRL